MIIRNLTLKNENDRTKMSAEISFEDSKREGVAVFFEIPSKYQRYLRPAYEPFLFSSFPAALYHHEKRIRIEGEICPEVVANVTAALYLQRKWYENEDLTVPVIEFERERVLEPVQGGIAGCFLSGGIDSLSNFCRNLSIYPENHENRFKAAFCVYGMDMGDPNKPDCEAIFEQTIGLLDGLTSTYGCQLVPIYTNARHLEQNWIFYEKRHYGALLAGMAHVMAGHIRRCSIALDHRSDFFVPHGSHPALNKYFSSSYLEVNSQMDAFSRSEKYKFFKKHPEVLNYLRVCYTIQDIKSDQINCGRCGKCTRTKLELLVNGLLEQTTTFPDKSIDPESVAKMKMVNSGHREFFGALIGPLRSLGRDDLADILQKEWDRPSYQLSIWNKCKHYIRAAYKALK